MPYNPQNIPSTPLPVSMMPAATEIQGSDLLLLVQTLQGVKRTRSMPISSLASSAPVQAVSDSKFFYSLRPTSGDAWTLDLSQYVDKHHLEIFLDVGPDESAITRTCTITFPQNYTGLVVLYSRITTAGQVVRVVTANAGEPPIQMRLCESVAFYSHNGNRRGSAVHQYDAITSNRLQLGMIEDDFSWPLNLGDDEPPIIEQQTYIANHFLDLHIGLQYKMQRSVTPTSSRMVFGLVDNTSGQTLKQVVVPIPTDSATGCVSCRILHKFTSSSGSFKLTTSIEDSATGFIDYPHFSAMGTYAGTL